MITVALAALTMAAPASAALIYDSEVTGLEAVEFTAFPNPGERYLVNFTKPVSGEVRLVAQVYRFRFVDDGMGGLLYDEDNGDYSYSVNYQNESGTKSFIFLPGDFLGPYTGFSVDPGRLSIFVSTVGQTSYGRIGLAGAGAVPEPETWGLMIVGFGLVGSAARARRRSARQFREHKT